MAAIEQNEETGTFTQAMRAAFSEHEDLKRLYASAQEEIARLQQEIADLRSGIGVGVVINGSTFYLTKSLPEPTPTFTMNNDWLNDQPQKHDTQRLNGSLVAFKE